MIIGFITVGAYMDQEDYARNNLLGSESQIFGLSKELVNKGHEVFIFRRWFESKMEIIDNIRIISFKSNECKSGLKMTYYKLKFSREVSKYIQNMELDIIILMDPFTAYFPLKLPIPKITVTHNEIPIDILPLEQISLINKMKYKFLRLMQDNLFKNSNITIALNTTIKQYLEKKGYKTLLIPNGINLNDYNSTNSNAREILFGGRFVKSKRIDDLINAYSNLSQEVKNKYELTIMGFGTEKSNLENLIKNLELEDRVKLIPWASKKEFIDRVSRCTVFVLPSQYETFGIVTIEAMALNKPVISSDSYGSLDIILDGYNGLLFKKGHTKSLTKKLESVLIDENLRIRIGKNARKIVEENYTFDKISDEYIDLFCKVKEN